MSHLTTKHTLLILFMFHVADNAGNLLACVVGVNGEGEGEQEGRRKMGNWG